MRFSKNTCSNAKFYYYIAKKNQIWLYLLKNNLKKCIMSYKSNPGSMALQWLSLWALGRKGRIRHFLVHLPASEGTSATLNTWRWRFAPGLWKSLRVWRQCSEQVNPRTSKVPAILKATWVMAAWSNVDSSISHDAGGARCFWCFRCSLICHVWKCHRSGDWE